MSALTTLLPGKRSRTSTQAISVPAAAFTAATASDAASVSFSAATAAGAVTASQNAARPPSSERATTAASGSTTMRLSQTVAIPAPSRPREAAAATRERPAGRRAGARAVTASTVSGDPRLLLDLREGARRRVEERVVDLAPAAEVADREEARRRRKLRRVGLQDGLVDGPVAPVGELLLRRLGEREAHERLRLGQRLALLHDGDRVLDRDRPVGDHVVDVLPLLLRRDRLVLVGEQDVAGARREGLQRLAPRLGLDLDVLGDQLVDVVGVLALAVRGEQVPLRRARRERVRGDDLDARLEQVVPR